MRFSPVAARRRREAEYRCSFCGKSQGQVHRLIAGPGGVYICNECVDLCREIIREETSGRRGRRVPGGPSVGALLLAAVLVLTGLAYARIQRQRRET